MPTPNPVLEGVRASGLAEEAERRQEQEDGAEELATTLDRVHASFLFRGRHEVAVQQFCRVLDATPAHILNNSWNALVVELGLDRKIIGCVHNMRDVSYTELILKSYASKPDASLGSLVKAVKKIDRMDAFVALQKSLEDIATDYQQSQDPDSGFSSIDTETGTEPVAMAYPALTDVRSGWKRGLPFTLRHLENDQAKTQESPRARHREESRMQGATVVPTEGTTVPQVPKTTPSCKVLITFAEDGKCLAETITKTLRTEKGRRPQIGVVVLDEHWEMVERNPEEFIMKWFQKVNYVIPVLTEGYLKAIRRKQATDSETTRSLDVEYAGFIKDLANKYYTANGCLNDKIRCVVPMKKRSVLSHTRCKIDPILKCYEYDTEIEKLARRMTKTFGSDDE